MKLKDYDKKQGLEQAERRISRVRSALILTDPFFGALALRLRPKAVDVMTIPGVGARMVTMATDGTHMYFSPMWLTTITDMELKGVYKHEVLHCALGHPFRLGGRDGEQWNIATDGAINRIILKQHGAVLPKGGVDITAFEGISKEDYETFNAEQLYPHVKPRPQKPQGGAGQPQAGGQGGEGDPDIAELPWGSVIPAPETSNGKTREEQEADWKVATVQAANTAKLQGRLPAELEQLVEELTRNRVDWKSYLRRFVQATAQADYTWTRPSQRYQGADVYMPSLYDETVPPIVVCFDTSGSCWNDQAKFFGELRHILDEVKPQKIYFLECDASVHEPVKELTPGDDIVPTVHGGGGTSFVPPFKWVEEHGIEPAAMIYLTDTYGDFPDHAPDYPVLWAVTVKDRHVPWGEEVYLGDD